MGESHEKSLRFYFLTAVVLLVLVFSAVHPLIVLADDSTPAAPTSPAAGDTSTPATQAPSTANTSVPAANATQPPPADTSGSAVTQAPPTTDTSAPAANATQPPPATDTSAPATTVASIDTTAAPVDTSVSATTVATTATTVPPTDTTASATATALAQVPTGTPVVVLDATGTAVPLATQAAADSIKNNDPVWCSGSAHPGDSGCTASDGSVTTITQLITAIGGLGLSSPTGGTIYFEYTNPASPYSTTDATFDHTNSNLTNLSDLTIQGGWNGGTTTSGTFGLSGSSYFSVPVTISNWTSDITLNDITITGITSGIGLNVTTSATTSGKGNIALHNVKSNNNTGHGAFLSNVAGNGNITIDSVSNDGSSGSSEFNGNTEDGLSVLSNGDITLTDVTADDNQNQPYDGAYLDNSSGSGAIRVDNSTFNNNTGGNGLTILSNGDITLTGVTAEDNYDDGVYLDNTSGSGNIIVDNTSGGDFNGNKASGLEAYSNGNVTLTYVTADGNYYDGALLGDYYNYVEVGGNITVTGGDFSNNDINGYCGCTDNPAGLEAYADGTISLTGGVTADDNYYDGVYLDNTSGSGDISVKDSTFGDSSGTDGNGSNGLEAYSNGNITLTNVTADGNYYDGALLDDPLTIWAISLLTAATSMIIRELDTVTTAPSLDALITLQVLKPMRLVISTYPA